MFLFLALACDFDPVEEGSLVVCLDGEDVSMGGDNVDLDVTGTAVGQVEGGDCQIDLLIEQADGTLAAIGWSLADAEANDLTPDFDVAVGDAVTLLYRYRMVWGDTAGFVLHDAEGAVVAAAEEGRWGNALEDGDVAGLSVSPGEVVATEATECEPLEGHTLVFEGDNTVEIEPVASETVTVGGADFTAYALRATSWGEGTGCDVSDTTETYAWALSR